MTDTFRAALAEADEPDVPAPPVTSILGGTNV